MDDLISRQAAIDLLKQMRKDGDMVPWEGKNVFARIRELPTIQPKLGTNLAEVGTDCISRQAAIDVCDNVIDLFRGQFGAGVVVAIKESIEELPSAQPKGHWIEIALSNHTYKCSVCGRLLVNITDGKNNVAKNYPYCHCGADMREVTE